MTPTRRELIEILQQISNISPEVRFGQLVVNFSYAAKGPRHEAIWDVEDAELLEAAKEYLEHKRQNASSAVER